MNISAANDGAIISLFVSAGAVAVMLYCLYQVISLRRSIPGGIIGKRWDFLTGLVVLFTVGYLSTPFFRAIPAEWMHILVALIFFFGAIYVLITVRLIYRVIAELTE